MSGAETCSSCFYYRSGDCRKHPPVRLPRKFSNDATQGNRVRDETLLWGWPQVQPSDWCGEFDPLRDGAHTQDGLIRLANDLRIDPWVRREIIELLEPIP